MTLEYSRAFLLNSLLSAFKVIFLLSKLNNCDAPQQLHWHLFTMWFSQLGASTSGYFMIDDWWHQFLNNNMVKECWDVNLENNPGLILFRKYFIFETESVRGPVQGENQWLEQRRNCEVILTTAVSLHQHTQITTSSSSSSSCLILTTLLSRPATPSQMIHSSPLLWRSLREREKNFIRNQN